MARVFDLDLVDAKICNRDFGGEKWGPDQRQFQIDISNDPKLVEDLIKDGVRLWQPESNNEVDPPRAYLTVKVDYRFGQVPIAMIAPDGSARKLTSRDVEELNSAWIKHSEMHIHGSSYEGRGRSGVSVYLDTLVVHLMSKEEVEERRSSDAARMNSVLEKYRGIFGL